MLLRRTLRHLVFSFDAARTRYKRRLAASRLGAKTGRRVFETLARERGATARRPVAISPSLLFLEQAENLSASPLACEMLGRCAASVSCTQLRPMWRRSTCWSRRSRRRWSESMLSGRTCFSVRSSSGPRTSRLGWACARRSRSFVDRRSWCARARRLVASLRRAGETGVSAFWQGSDATATWSHSSLRILECPGSKHL